MRSGGLRWEDDIDWDTDTRIAALKAAKNWNDLLEALDIDEQALIDKLAGYIEDKINDFASTPGLWSMLTDLVGEDNEDALVEAFLQAFGFKEEDFNIPLQFVNFRD